MSNKLEAEILIPSSLVSKEEQKNYSIIAFLKSFGTIGGNYKFGIAVPKDYVVTVVIEKNSFNLLKSLLISGNYFDLKLHNTTYICCYVDGHMSGDYAIIEDYVFNDEVKIICLMVKSN